MPMMPSALEEAEISNVYTSLVNPSGITVVPCSPTAKPLKTITDVKNFLQQGRKQDLKYLLRNNAWPVDHPVRNQLWPVLCTQHQNEKSSNSMEGFYWEMVKQVFGTMELPDKPINLPPFVEPSHCHSYYLTHTGRAVVDRVVSVLGYAYPDIVYSPTIYPICALLLHFISEEECYNCMVCLVVSKEKTFITQTKLLYEVTWKTVMQISKKHVVGALRRRENWRKSMFCFLFWLQKGPAVFLQRHCNSSRAERIYIDWIWWIFHGLPFQHLIRIMDCFFHEGIKVFYRTAMAILILFYKSSSSSSEFLAEIQKNGVDSALTKFCKEMPVTPQKFLKVAFGIRGLSSAYISRVFVRTEMVLKSKTVISGSRQLVRSRSSENLPNSQSQNNIQMVSHTLTIRELLTLWSWLPVRITMYTPILLYTTEEHGCSLTTFYVRVEQHEPTLLLIKTCNNEVFGAYCSSRWCERNQKDQRGNRQAYFGTGETFLFSLYPERAKYAWVGIDADRVEHGAELFMAADTKMITIGGGEGQAIWMDENIRFGKTDRCSTFNNPPLCPNGDFEIRVLEVYGFATEQ